MSSPTGSSRLWCPRRGRGLLSSALVSSTFFHPRSSEAYKLSAEVARPGPPPPPRKRIHVSNLHNVAHHRKFPIRYDVGQETRTPPGSARRNTAAKEQLAITMLNAQRRRLEVEHTSSSVVGIKSHGSSSAARTFRKQKTAQDVDTGPETTNLAYHTTPGNASAVPGGAASAGAAQSPDEVGPAAAAAPAAAPVDPQLSYSVEAAPSSMGKWLSRLAIHDAIKTTTDGHFVASVKKVPETEKMFMIAVTPVKDHALFNDPDGSAAGIASALTTRDAAQGGAAGAAAASGASASEPVDGTPAEQRATMGPTPEIIPLAHFDSLTPPKPKQKPLASVAEHIDYLNEVKELLGMHKEHYDQVEDNMEEGVKTANVALDRMRKLLPGAAEKKGKDIIPSCNNNGAAAWVPVAADGTSSTTNTKLYRPASTDPVCRCGAVSIGGDTGLVMEASAGTQFGCFEDGETGELRWSPPWNLQPALKRNMQAAGGVLADMLCSEGAPAMGLCEASQTVAGKVCDAIFGCTKEDCCITST